jgi:hypothetical protein
VNAIKRDGFGVERIEIGRGDIAVKRRVRYGQDSTCIGEMGESSRIPCSRIKDPHRGRFHKRAADTKWLARKQCEVERDERVLRPVEEPRRYPNMLHEKEELPDRCWRADEIRHAALLKSREELRFEFDELSDFGRGRVTVERRGKQIACVTAAAVPQWGARCVHQLLNKLRVVAKRRDVVD